MSTRTYGQYCGLARAMEMVGERWALLIVRDLLVGSKRFTDLHRGLAGIPTNVLTDRLKELEQVGVVRRRLLPRPAGSIVYELTEYGGELEDVLHRFGLWGAKSLGDPRPGEIITADSMVMAMRSTFRPEAARGTRASYELHFGEIVINVRVRGAKLVVEKGPLPGADLVVQAGIRIKSMMTGEMTPAEALRSGAIHIIGDPALLTRFAEMFRIDPLPQAAAV
jgi:DNA-binding HxlR family transcriptional regulator